MQARQGTKGGWSSEHQSDPTGHDGFEGWVSALAQPPSMQQIGDPRTGTRHNV